MESVTIHLAPMSLGLGKAATKARVPSEHIMVYALPKTSYVDPPSGQRW